MMENIKSRDRLIGHVMGKLVFANIDDQVLEHKLLMGEVSSLLRQLNDEFYEKARKMPIDKFWKEFLKPRWNASKNSEANPNQDMVDILASFFYH